MPSPEIAKTVNTSAPLPLIDARTYRTIMGLWPTGVCVVTGHGEEGELFGLVIGSFTSVSIEPPLVAFCPQLNSSSWQKLRQGQHLCINFLSESQTELCRRFSSGGIHGRFDGLELIQGRHGVPRLTGCCAWLDVRIEQEIAAGDHWIVLCHVEAMSRGGHDLPLLFSRGQLCKSSPLIHLPDDHFGAWERCLNQSF